ncbi:oxidoreductase-like domain-containing protein [Chitinibacter sp. GC72]|uniref:oxidoreductase-like domain-containing protein n=1 Tax=Chitinibacter sp. GC72 TaxID=1526917 RepID=UPI0012F9B55E|nr:oxidoreductase-like domain-containing protein [Chitinibacter sp. GC72]
MDEKQRSSAAIVSEGQHIATAVQADPEPQAPIEPPLEACCTSGCAPCIFDDYAEQMNEYRVAHMAWKARQAAKQ